ncbi:MAG: alanine racemase [Candidatus Aminicenantes bacterium 4484_214]|nr:MAG: alanine racemase [Candidatus Aminicenantes bacterium 4484_214]
MKSKQQATHNKAISRSKKGIKRRTFCQLGFFFPAVAFPFSRIFKSSKEANRSLSLSTPRLSSPSPLSSPSSPSSPLFPPLRSSVYDPWIELDLDALSWNLDKIRHLTKVQIMAVIKANAYGHGLVEVARALEKKKVAALMAGKLQEALILREEGIVAPIFNFGPFGKEDVADIIRYQIQQCVYTPEVEALSKAARQRYQQAAIHVHIDTGMGRAGVPFPEALSYLEKVSSLEGIQIAGISTTLTEDPEFDRLQLKRFLEVCRQAEEKGISIGLKHVASSSGILTLPESHLDLVRPGIMLYGYYPSTATQLEDRLQLRPVLHLKCRVYMVKTLSPGDSVSYHRAYTASKKEKIALLPLGYSDGYPPNTSEKSAVLIRGKRFPLIVSPTANHLEVLLGENSEVRAGDEAVLIGPQKQAHISAFELGQWSNQSVYKVLINLNPLLPRRT